MDECKPLSVGSNVNPLFLIPDPLKPYRYWAPGRKGFEVGRCRLTL